MNSSKSSNVSSVRVILAFAIVYIVWGSTYFFIQRALSGLPPFMVGAIRFLSASGLMLGWCLYKKENVFSGRQIKSACISGILLLFIGNGAVVWVEQYLSSALVAITVSSSPLWFVLLDKPKWKENLTNKATVGGLVIGFVGVFLLFYKNISSAFSDRGHGIELIGMFIVVLGAISWAGGSLYSKYTSSGSAVVNTTWQMFTAGITFIVVSLARGELNKINWTVVPISVWASVAYLAIFGSIVAFSAYIWLLEVRPAAQVSTYAYINPVVAVLLGVFLANESISVLQIIGLTIILFSVLLINLAKYRRAKALRQNISS